MMRFKRGKQLQGPAGTATRLELDSDMDRPDQAATIATWWLDCPGQSPEWSNYLLSIVHLRPMPDVKPATITVPHSSHELMMFALDPGKNPVPEDPITWSFLSPVNLVEQIELPSDEKADELLELCVEGVLSGTLWAEPPLSGQVEPWRTALIKTAAHLRGEEHAP